MVDNRHKNSKKVENKKITTTGIFEKKLKFSSWKLLY